MKPSLLSLPTKYLIRVPNVLDAKQAIALLVDWSTAYAMAHNTAHVRAAQKVFVHGLSGGVGLALAKLCALQGAQVYGTASKRNHDVVRAAISGATVFDYSDKAWIASMREMGGADAVFDPLGFESWDESWDILSRSGILIGYGGNLLMLTGSKPPSMWPQVAKLLGSNAILWSGRRTRFCCITRDDATFAPNLSTLFGMLGEGNIEVPIRKVFELEKVPEAHATWNKVGGVGSVVVRVAGDAEKCSKRIVL